MILPEQHLLRAQSRASEAIEYMDFKVTGAYVGEHTPEFILARPQTAAAATDNNDTIVSETEVKNDRV